jgi:hypothetical protein
MDEHEYNSLYEGSVSCVQPVFSGDKCLLLLIAFFLRHLSHAVLAPIFLFYKLRSRKPVELKWLNTIYSKDLKISKIKMQYSATSM